MQNIDINIFKKVNIGNNVKLYAEEVNIKDGVVIGDNVFIASKKIEIGFDTVIESGTYVKAIDNEMEQLILGDNCLIGSNNRIMVPRFIMKDYTQLHNSSLISGYQPIEIGYNCWIGQGAILNSYEKLKIGNNVRMGNTQIWTHVASGELLEGSCFNNSKKVIIHDDVWFMGFGHLVSPGVVVAEKSVIMAGSVLTKDTEPMKTYSGIPAVDISNKLPAWKPMTLSDKTELMKKFIDDFKSTYASYCNNIHFINSNENSNRYWELNSLIEPQVIVSDCINLEHFIKSQLSIFDLKTKMYLKRRTPIEIAWIKYNIGCKARFLPYQYQ